MGNWGDFTLLIGFITPVITGRGPTLYHGKLIDLIYTPPKNKQIYPQKEPFQKECIFSNHSFLSGDIR